MIDLREISNIFSGFIFGLDSLIDINDDYEKEANHLKDVRTSKRIKELNRFNKLVEKCVTIYAENRLEIQKLDDKERMEAYSEFLDSLTKIKGIVQEITKYWDDNDCIDGIKKEIDGIYSSLVLDMKDIEFREDIGLKSK